MHLPCKGSRESPGGVSRASKKVINHRSKSAEFRGREIDETDVCLYVVFC
jgi:hypothetical protein